MARRVDWKAFFGGNLGYQTAEPHKLARLIEPGQKYDPDKYVPVDTSTMEYQYRAAANRAGAAQARELEAKRQAEREQKYNDERETRNRFLDTYQLTPEQRTQLSAYPIKPDDPTNHVAFLDFFQLQYPKYQAENQRREKFLTSLNDSLRYYYMAAREKEALLGRDPDLLPKPKYHQVGYYTPPEQRTDSEPPPLATVRYVQRTLPPIAGAQPLPDVPKKNQMIVL